MEMLKTDYGVNVVLFTDDYPTPDRSRWERLLDLLIEKDLGQYILMETRAADIIRDEDILSKYRQAGIIHIYVGTGVYAADESGLHKEGLEHRRVKKSACSLPQAWDHNRNLHDTGLSGRNRRLYCPDT